MIGKQEGPYKGEETKAEEDKLWHSVTALNNLILYIQLTVGQKSI